MATILTIRTAATTVGAFILLAIVSAFISANIRHFAAAKGLDSYLTGAWNYFLPNGPTDMRSRWNKVRGKWWLWLLFGLSSGLASALWVLTLAGPTLPSDGPIPPTPSQRQYTSTQLEIRHQAIRDLNISMTGPVRAALLKAKKIEADGVGALMQSTGSQALIDRLRDLQMDVKNAFANLNDVLTKYQTYGEIQNISPAWKYEPILKKSEQFIEILTLASKPLTFPLSPVLQRARDEWGTSVAGFEEWFDQAMHRISEKGAEYDKAPISK